VSRTQIERNPDRGLTGLLPPPEGGIAGATSIWESAGIQHVIMRVMLRQQQEHQMHGMAWWLLPSGGQHC
jgi:hypothetical protein